MVGSSLDESEPLFCYRLEEMEGEEDKSDYGLVLQIFRNFMSRVTQFEELVNLGSRFLSGFHQGLEFLRRPGIDSKSQLIGSIIKANDTTRLKSYFEAGCINPSDEVHECQLGLLDHLSKAKSIVNELKCLLENVNGVMQAAIGTMSTLYNKDLGDGLEEEATTNDKGEVASSNIIELATLMGILYSMIQQDYTMQEKIVLALNPSSSSGELESYDLMWSLRPFVKDEVMSRAWNLIP